MEGPPAPRLISSEIYYSRSITPSIHALSKYCHNFSSTMLFQPIAKKHSEPRHCSWKLQTSPRIRPNLFHRRSVYFNIERQFVLRVKDNCQANVVLFPVKFPKICFCHYSSNSLQHILALSLSPSFWLLGNWKLEFIPSLIIGTFILVFYQIRSFYDNLLPNKRSVLLLHFSFSLWFCLKN